MSCQVFSHHNDRHASSSVRQADSIFSTTDMVLPSCRPSSSASLSLLWTFEAHRRSTGGTRRQSGSRHEQDAGQAARLSLISLCVSEREERGQHCGRALGGQGGQGGTRQSGSQGKQSSGPVSLSAASSTMPPGGHHEAKEMVNRTRVLGREVAALRECRGTCVRWKSNAESPSVPRRSSVAKNTVAVPSLFGIAARVAFLFFYLFFLFLLANIIVLGRPGVCLSSESQTDVLIQHKETGLQTEVSKRTSFGVRRTYKTLQAFG